MADNLRGNTYRARALALLKRVVYVRSERDANDGMQDAFNMAMKNSDGWKDRAVAAEARCADLEPEVKACHEIMRQVRIVCGDEYTGTMDAVKGLHQRCAELERLLSAARAYRDAELHCAAHKMQCRAGCDTDTDCAAYGDLWLAEMWARKAMWDALDSLSLAPQTDGGKLE